MAIFRQSKGAAKMAINYHKGAVYTVELGCLIENGFDIGMQSYPIFDETYRDALNQKIVEHFWFREIGQETPQLFKMFLNRAMNENMPYFNELYKTAVMDFDPYVNYDMTTTGKRDGSRDEQRDGKRTETYTDTRTDDASTTNVANSTSNGETTNYAFPQNQLAPGGNYATSAAKSDSTSATDSTTHAASTSTGTNGGDAVTADTAKATTVDEYIEHVAGVTGQTKAEALLKFRDAIINVDMMVIQSLEPCFMQLWGAPRNLW